MRHSIVTFSLILINLVVFLLQFLSGADSTNPLVALDWGANFAPFTFGDDWWRLMTSMFLHYGIFHLLVNMFGLYQLGKNLEYDIGSFGLLCLFLLTGLFAGLTSLYWNLFVFSAGASGALFGLFGFDITFEILKNIKDLKRIRHILINFVIYVGIMVFLGTQLPFDNAAHLGGLFFGVVLALLYPYTIHKRSLAFKSTFLILCAITIVCLYLILPRYQKEYFDISQKALFVEKRSKQILNGEYASDAVYLQDIKAFRPSWDSILWSLDMLVNIPEELAIDKRKFATYVQFRALEMDYILIGTEKESYIYVDSLDIARDTLGSMEKPKYIFDFSAPPPDTLSKNDQTPKNEIVREYYDSIWRPSDAWNAKYYRLGYQDSLGQWDGPVRDFFENGRVQMKGVYSAGLRDGIFIYYSRDNKYDAAGRYRKDQKVGKWEYFHDNGRLSQEIRYRDKNYMVNSWSEDGIIQVKEGNGVVKEYHDNGTLAKYEVYVEGLQDSVSYGYHENGQPYYREVYNRGDLISGVSYSLNNEVFNYDISTYIPHPIGGMNSFRQHEMEVKRDKHNLLIGESGRVELVFSLTNEGEIFNLKVLNGVNSQIDEIAKQILLDGPKWIPGKLHGQEPIAVEGYVVIPFP